MKAIIIQQHGEPDVLKVAEVDTPEINSASDIKVKLLAAGVNPIDTKLRRGMNPIKDFPAILGCDGAGVVAEVGSTVKDFKPGDEVYFFHGGLSGIQGNYAEYKVLDESFVAHKPKSIDYFHAAAAPLVLLTAWEALFDRANLKQDQTVFINAGAGGVGHVAIQLAKYAGAQVCTTISSEEKAAFVNALGADHIINYKEEDVAESILEWTAGKGVDIALDNIGGRQTDTLFPIVKHYGDVVSLLIPDKELDWSVARFKNLRFSMEVMLTPLLFGLKDQQAKQTEILKKCATLIDDKKLTVKLNQTLALDEVVTAHQLIESGHTLGKIVLEI